VAESATGSTGGGVDNVLKKTRREARGRGHCWGCSWRCTRGRRLSTPGQGHLSGDRGPWRCPHRSRRNEKEGAEERNVHAPTPSCLTQGIACNLWDNQGRGRRKVGEERCLQRRQGRGMEFSPSICLTGCLLRISLAK